MPIEFLKVEWDAEPSPISSLSCGSSSQFGFRRRASSQFLRLGFERCFLIKLTVSAGSGDAESSFNYAAMGSDCWCTSPFTALVLLHIINFCLISCSLSCFFGLAVLLFLFSFTSHPRFQFFIFIKCQFIAHYRDLSQCEKSRQNSAEVSNWLNFEDALARKQDLLIFSPVLKMELYKQRHIRPSQYVYIGFNFIRSI